MTGINGEKGPAAQIAAWRSVLREIVRTLDVLLGGDHRRYGHVPPEHCEPPTAPPPKCEDSARSVRRAW